MARAPSKDLRRRVLTAAEGGKMSAGFGIGIFLAENGISQLPITAQRVPIPFRPDGRSPYRSLHESAPAVLPTLSNQLRRRHPLDCHQMPL